MPSPRPRAPLALAVLATAALCVWACAEPLEPAGARNPAIDALVAADWQSNDSVFTIDPRTGEETVRAYVNDLSPDTLADGRIIFQVAEYMPVLETCVDNDDPVFCTQATLAEFTRANLRYPRPALVRGIGGSGAATFVITPEGRVTDTGIERGLGDALDQEMLRLVGTLPPWRPGFHDGEPVAVRYRLPVTFTPPTD